MACQAEPGGVGRFAIATPHRAASEAGAAALRAGGSAIDAAITASAVLGVAYPHMCGIGGDLFALVAGPAGDVVAVNGSGAAPASIDPEAVRRDHAEMPRAGPLTVTVPGTVAAWGTLLELGARRDLRAALAPAAGLARRGLAVAPSLARALADEGGRVLADGGLRAVFAPTGAPLAVGDEYADPELAATLEAIAVGGPDALYRGPVGERLVAGLAAAGCPLDVGDLARHRTERTPPLVHRYGDAEVLTAPPNSQGCCLLAVLAVVEALELERDHLGEEAGRLAALMAAVTAERDRGLCDPRTGPDLSTTLLGPAGLTRLSAQVADHEPAAGGPPARPATGDTVAVVVADAGGTVVSLIHSLYGAFGSGIREPATGIVAHNRGAGFVLDDAHPNGLRPGRRPAHTLMPVLARRGGRVVLAAGTMGGSAHPQIHTELLLACLDRGLDPAAAVALPRWVVGGLGGDGPADGAAGVVDAEATVPPAALRAIERAGFRVRRLGPVDEGVGHAQVIARDPDGRLRAGSDPRADGAAVVE